MKFIFEKVLRYHPESTPLKYYILNNEGTTKISQKHVLYQRKHFL